MNIVLFEDARCSQLAPLDVLRPAYTIHCGSLCLADLAAAMPGRVCGSVRPHLHGTQPDYIGNNALDASQPALYLNARLAPHAGLMQLAHQWLLSADAFQLVDGDDIVAAYAPGGVFGADADTRPLTTELLKGSALPQQAADAGLRLLRFPHEILAEHTVLMQSNLEHRLRSGHYRELAPGVFLAGAASLPEHVAFDVSGGPVILDEGVAVGPFSVIQGPAYIGNNSRVMPHSLLKANVAIGRECRIGGEVSQSIVESYTNKAHFGYLGNSYVGGWVNLGAGTTNSNLKNTYGTVRVSYGEQTVDTGMQFLGCMIGDYSKTAIQTSIYTGKLIGVCSNVYGVVASNVPSFTNYAQRGGCVTEHPPTIAEVAQRRVFARRGIQQRACDVQLLRDAYALEADGRDLGDRPPSL